MKARGYSAVAMVLLPVLLVVLGMPASPDFRIAHASTATRYVAPAGDCGGASPCYGTIQQAVNAASPGDEIRVAAGTYSGISQIAGSKQVVYVDRSLTLRGGYTPSNWATPDPEANATIVNALAQGRAMVVVGDVDLTVEGMRFSYGNARGAGSGSEDDLGGGIYVSDASLTLVRSWVLNNSTSDEGSGGGLYARDSAGGITVRESAFSGNFAGHGGGAYVSNSSFTLEDNLFESNSAGAVGGKGSGVCLGNSSGLLAGNTLRNNTSASLSYGGGIAVMDGSATLTANVIEDNEVTAWGGGVYLYEASAVLTGNTLRRNESNHGAGVYILTETGESVTLRENTIQDNRARKPGDQNGGGVFVQSSLGGETVLEGNLVQGNQATSGGGLHLTGGFPITLLGNTIQDNVASSAWGGSGGGIYSNGSEVTLSGNFLLRNQAQAGQFDYGAGGGLYLDGEALLYNNVICDNQVTGSSSTGAGVRLRGNASTFYHTTIANNTGGDGAGIAIRGDDLSKEPGQPALYNTILANQVVGVKVESDVPQNLASLHGVLWWNNGANLAGAAFAFDQKSGDPRFFDAANDDYHLGAGSAAIDGGVLAGVATDVDGEPRWGTPDLGADEYWLEGSYVLVSLPVILRH